MLSDSRAGNLLITGICLQDFINYIRHHMRLFYLPYKNKNKNNGVNNSMYKSVA